MKSKPSTSYRPAVGDVRWFVEWCVKVGMVDEEHPEYGCEPDKNVMKRRMAMTREEAMEIARKVYPQAEAVGGDVAYWPAEFVPYDEDDAAVYPHAGFWEDTSDAEYYDGEARS